VRIKGFDDRKAEDHEGRLRLGPVRGGGGGRQKRGRDARGKISGDGPRNAKEEEQGRENTCRKFGECPAIAKTKKKWDCWGIETDRCRREGRRGTYPEEEARGGGNTLLGGREKRMRGRTVEFSGQ